MQRDADRPRLSPNIEARLRRHIMTLVEGRRMTGAFRSSWRWRCWHRRRSPQRRWPADRKPSRKTSNMAIVSIIAPGDIAVDDDADTAISAGALQDICSTGGAVSVLACNAYLRGAMEGLLLGSSARPATCDILPAGRRHFIERDPIDLPRLRRGGTRAPPGRGGIDAADRAGGQISPVRTIMTMPPTSRGENRLRSP